jgi:predicted DCC family thiol-disulfide oxidoreductase YuxK
MNGFQDNKPAVGWILYDGSCGICRGSASFWENALRRRGFAMAALQENWVMEKLNLPSEELLDEMRLLLADGTHLAGPDVYRYAMRRIWWALPLYLFSVLPGCRRVFDFAYRSFARNRHRVSAACGLK